MATICLFKIGVIWPLPDSMSNEMITQFVVNPWTMYGMLIDLKVPTGEYVLQTRTGLVSSKHLI